MEIHEPVTRRALLGRASVLPMGAIVAAGLAAMSRTATAQTPIPRVGGSKLKTSLNAYSFSKALNDQLQGRAAGISLLGLLEYCAEQNLDAIDPTGYFFPGYPKVPSDAYLNEFKRRAFALGIDISGTGVRNNFANPDKQAREADVRHVKEWIECAARMGAPVIRVFAGAQPEGYQFEQVATWMVDDLGACVDHGKRYGVLVGIQNHGDTLKTSEQVLRIVKIVNSEWFGVIVDTGYFLTPDPYEDIARVAPFAVNWQVKEKVGNARIDMPRLVSVIRRSGYRGYLPIETLSVKGEDYDPRTRVAALLKELRAALEQSA